MNIPLYHLVVASRLWKTSVSALSLAWTKPASESIWNSGGWARILRTSIETLFPSRKIFWRRRWPPTPGFLPGKLQTEKTGGLYGPWDRGVRYDWANPLSTRVLKSVWATKAPRITVRCIKSADKWILELDEGGTSFLNTGMSRCPRQGKWALYWCEQEPSSTPPSPGPSVLTAGELDIGLGKVFATEIWWRGSGESLVPWSLIPLLRETSYLRRLLQTDQSRAACWKPVWNEHEWVLPNFLEGQQLSGRNRGQRSAPLASLKARGPGRTCAAPSCREQSRVLGDRRWFSRGRTGKFETSSLPGCPVASVVSDSLRPCGL